MSFTNGQLAQKISDLIGYWTSYITEYANWLGGSATGGPSSDGLYPLTDYQGNESLVKSPAKLQDDVDGQVSSASVSAGNAATSETNAATSASTATTQAGLADTARIAAELAEVNAETAETGAVDAKVTAIAQAAAALVSANNAAADAVLTAADAIATAADRVQTGIDAAAAATFNPALYATLAGATFTGALIGTTLRMPGGTPATPHVGALIVDTGAEGIIYFAEGSTADQGFYCGTRAAGSLNMTWGYFDGARNDVMSINTFKNLVIHGGTIYQDERAAAGGASAGQGQWWIRNDTANTAMFMDDAGVNFEVAGSTVAVVRPGTTTDPMARWDGTNWVPESTVKLAAGGAVFELSALGAQLKFTNANGPLGLQFRSAGNPTTAQIDIQYRTSPAVMRVERVSDTATIIEIDAADLSVDFAGAIAAASNLETPEFLSSGSLMASQYKIGISGSLGTGRLTTSAAGKLASIHGFYDDEALEISKGSTAAYKAGIVIAARSSDAATGEGINFQVRGAEVAHIGNGTFDIQGIGTLSAEWTHSRPAGNSAVYYKSTSAGNITAPALRWQDSAAVNIAAIRGQVTAGVKELALGTEWFGEKLKLVSTGRHKMTGGLDISGHLYIGGDAIGHFTAVSGNYGSVQVNGAEGSSGSWHGYSISGQWVFMANGGAAGIYDDANNKWCVNYTANGAVDLRYNSAVKFSTVTDGAKTTGIQYATTKFMANDLGVPYYVTSGYIGGKITVSASAPSTPAKGDIWFDTT